MTSRGLSPPSVIRALEGNTIERATFDDHDKRGGGPRLILSLTNGAELAIDACYFNEIKEPSFCIYEGKAA